MDGCRTYGRPMVMLMIAMMTTLLATERWKRWEEEEEEDEDDDDWDGDGNVSRFTNPTKPRSKFKSKQLQADRSSCGRLLTDEGHTKRTKGAEKQAETRQDDDSVNDKNYYDNTAHHLAVKHRREHCE